MESNTTDKRILKYRRRLDVTRTMGPAIEYAIQNGTGIFSVLFICLLAWVLKTNNDREKRLQAIIEENQRYVVAVIKDMKSDIKEIKQWMQSERR